MRRGVTREEVLRTTQELITRNGIRAVRVDEIARKMGISKRTLYELFADKEELMNTCLDEIGRQRFDRIVAERGSRPADALSRAMALAEDYVVSLLAVDLLFLNDICRKRIFAEQYDQHRRFWIETLTEDLEACAREGALDTEGGGPSPARLADRILFALLTLRLEGAEETELRQCLRILFRGIATVDAIRRLDTER